MATAYTRKLICHMKDANVCRVISWPLRGGYEYSNSAHAAFPVALRSIFFVKFFLPIASSALARTQRGGGGGGGGVVQGGALDPPFKLMIFN